VREGLANLEKHVENMRKFNICPVVAINKFATDTDQEINIILERCKALGVKAAVADVWARGGAGAEDLARIVSRVAEECSSNFKPLYDWSWPIEKKIETIAKEIYGASAIDYTPQAKTDLKNILQLGLDKLPVCMAKTQKSLSDNPKLLGRPKNFVVTVREIEIAAGAGFIIPITGNIMRMPGLPKIPAAEGMNIDDDGVISGLS
jgi:formate--tetrahydrofolate ligase